jgi:hypothetical protein
LQQRRQCTCLAELLAEKRLLLWEQRQVQPYRWQDRQYKRERLRVLQVWLLPPLPLLLPPLPLLLPLPPPPLRLAPFPLLVLLVLLVLMPLGLG